MNDACRGKTLSEVVVPSGCYRLIVQDGLKGRCACIGNSVHHANIDKNGARYIARGGATAHAHRLMMVNNTPASGVQGQCPMPSLMASPGSEVSTVRAGLNAMQWLTGHAALPLPLDDRFPFVKTKASAAMRPAPLSPRPVGRGFPEQL